MVKHVLAASLCSLACLLGGCAVTPSTCNPADADVSFYVKSKCYFSGAYARREDQKRATLEEELRIKSLFEETYAALKDEQTRLEQANTAKRSALSSVTQSVNSLQKALQTKTQADGKLKQQIAALQAEVEKIQQQPGESPMQQRQALSDLTVKVTDLQKTVDLR